MHPSERPPRRLGSAATTAELMQAVRQDLLDVAHQPIVDLRDHRVGATESLVRWRHPRLGLLLPASFLPLAGPVGGMPALDLLVLRAACRRAAASRGTPPTSVNVSRASLLRRGFVEATLQTLNEHDVTGEGVLLELSEELTLDDLELVRDELLLLRRAGVQLVLDDLGAGATTTQHVRMLAPSWVKIDRSLVAGVHACPERLDQVGRIVAFARAHGARVTAEGVEHEAEALALAGLGCERGQGWLFGRPVLEPTTSTIGDHGLDQRPQERHGSQHRRQPLGGGGLPARQAG